MGLRLWLPPSMGKFRDHAKVALLSEVLSNELGEPIDVGVAADYDQLLQRMNDGEADVIWAPPALVASLGSAAVAVFKSVRRGRTSYRSAIVARRDAGLTIDALAGTRAAWVDRRSVGGYLLAVDHLRSLGHAPDLLFADQSFEGSYPKALLRVADGQADVSAIAVYGPTDVDLRDMLDQYLGVGFGEGLERVAVTAETPNDALVFGTVAGLRIAELLLDPETMDGSFRALKVALEVDTFERASVEEYRPLRDIIRRAGIRADETRPSFIPGEMDPPTRGRAE